MKHVKAILLRQQQFLMMSRIMINFAQRLAQHKYENLQLL